MRKTLLILFFLVSSTFVKAQPYGNEWIDYDQIYYEFQISQDGVYTIDQTTLLNAGIPLQNIDPRNIQLFARETEVPIYISGENDGVFDENDVIEFLAFQNDGWLDSLIYPDPNWLSNPHYSMFNDTLTYFLTWNEEIDNLRMDVEEGTNFSDYEDIDYVWKESIQYYPEVYWGGPVLNEGLRLPIYSITEGWYATRIGYPSGNTMLNLTLETPQISSAQNLPPTILKTVVAGVNNAATESDYNHHLQMQYGTNSILLTDTFYNGYILNRFEHELNTSELSSNGTPLKLSVINDLNIAADYQSFSWLSVKYPHELAPSGNGNFYFETSSSGADDYLHLSLDEINNNSVIYVYGSNPVKIIPEITGTTLDALIPNNQSKCLLSDPTQISAITELNKVSVSGLFTNYSEMELDSAFVIVTHPDLAGSAESYADFRSNSERDALVVDINELYRQFGGGIEKHEIAIRRFSELILDSWNSKPGHLFLLGKSIEQQLCRQNPAIFNKNLVPSFGWPASDILITAGLNNNNYEPAIPTGRISAITESQINDYRNKAFVFENQEPAEWMKNIMHFGGGSNSFEQSLFASYLNGYKEIIQDTCFGANVYTFLKESTLPIEVTLSDSISDIIKNGTSILTFFGHASGNSFDYSIDEPQNLEWDQHYPLFIGNSCFTGNIHLENASSTSEDFVLIPDKGAIGFIASVNLGFSSTLNVYTKKLYEELSVLNYGKSIGELMQKTVEQIQGFSPTDELINTCLGMTLEGDPSLIINSPALPDLSIKESDISFTPENITILTDSIEVQVIITNIGKSTSTPFEVQLKRHFPNSNIDSVYFKTIEGLTFKDTLLFKLPVVYSNAIGINDFDVSIDLPINLIDEIDDFGNNSASTSIVVSQGSVLPIYPYDFAIVGEDNISLIANTGSPFSVSKDYRFEIDTTNTFSSPFLETTTINAPGGVITWDLPYTLTDSLVYFWRVSPDSTASEPYQWNNSSFQYISGQEGWAQSHFQQYENNQFQNLLYNEQNEQLSFLTGTKELKCQVLGNGLTNLESSDFRIDGQTIELGGCLLTPAIHVAVIEPQNLDVWGTNYNGANPDNEFGQLNGSNGPCRNRVEYYFIFQRTSAIQQDSLISLLENKIPDGHYVLIYSWRFFEPNFWQPEFLNKMQEMGAQDVGTSPEPLPFIFMTEMGNPSNSVEIIGDTINSYIELYFDLPISGSNGRMTSNKIGPTNAWERLWYKNSALESQANDNTIINAKGITNNGSELEINAAQFDGDDTFEIDIQDLIDPDTFPEIRLIGNYADSITQTPSQTKAWHVNYVPAPESALNPNVGFYFNGDTIAEGEQLEIAIAIENVSPWDMDSLVVQYWIEDRNNQKHYISYPKQDSLRSGAILLDTVFINTIGFSGINNLWVEVNPVNPVTGYHYQKEQYHFNNITQLPFFVQKDIENPVLDVVIDGIHILDGELISPKPDILITLDDENPYLLMNQPEDTVYFSIFITDPLGEQKRMTFGENETHSLIFEPATDEENISKLRFNPNLTLDGGYKLLVIAADKSGNASGNVNYEINFEVDHESSVTQLVNYPNPFSTRTHFVFTLTGEVIPDYIKIQIMTITGKVVKTIFKEDLGNLRIGRNVTDYAWDGRDEFGDQLANGVYIYRVVTKYQGQELKLRTTNADNYFKNGYGKMYLLR